VTNGRRLRLLRDSERFTRPSYVEFDIEGIIDGNQYPGWSQAVDATASSNFSEGDAQPRVCRGRQLSSAATASSSS
jgi:hypothetical protein